MKRGLMAVVAAGILAFSMAGAVSADQGGVPNANACFGQGRSGYASTHSGDESNGKFISQRKGDNPEINREWITENC